MSDGNLRQLFRRNLTGVFWTSVETGFFATGVPDSYGCYRGNSFWIEYKATRAWRVRMRLDQVAWLQHHDRAGGRAFIAVRRMTKTVDELWLLKAAAADMGLTLAAVQPWGKWAGGPRRWPWEKVLAALTA